MSVRWFRARIRATLRAMRLRLRASAPPRSRSRLASRESVPEDPEEHAVQFAEEWYDRLEFYARQRLRALGVAEPRIGSFDLDQDFRHAAFHPSQRVGGGSSPGARVNLDSGVLNPKLFSPELGPEITTLWEKSRLRDRIDAVIAHEHHESLGLSHAEAVALAPDTPLPIRDGARRILRAIHEREQGSGRGR